MRRVPLVAASVLGLLAFAPVARADDPPTFRLTLKDDAFEPAEIRVPANARFVITVRNASSKPAEFESTGLGAEKVISAGREATVRVQPLAPGRYAFMNEFNPQAQGVVVAE